MKLLTSVLSVALVTAGIAGYAPIAGAEARAESGARSGTRDPRVNDRQHHQRQRIQQGVRSGELTRNEVRGLREDQRDIHQLERAYKSDGALTRDERKDLHQELNQASREIHEEKHDEDVR